MQFINKIIIPKMISLIKKILFNFLLNKKNKKVVIRVMEQSNRVANVNFTKNE